MQLLLLVIIILAIVGFLLLINICNNTCNNKQRLHQNIDIKELTPKQTILMIELGIIKIYNESMSTGNDYDTKIVYTDGLNKCNIYRNVFGHYYCK